VKASTITVRGGGVGEKKANLTEKKGERVIPGASCQSALRVTVLIASDEIFLQRGTKRKRGSEVARWKSWWGVDTDRVAGGSRRNRPEGRPSTKKPDSGDD